MQIATRLLIAAALSFTARAEPPTTAPTTTRATLVAGGGADPNAARATDAKLDAPFGVARAADGNLLIIDFAGKLRAVTPDGKLATLCGGAPGDRGDGGPAKDALLNAPHALAVGPDGDVFIADTLNHRVRRIDARTGLISTFAGTTKGFSGDGGPAARAQFSGIYCIAFSPDRAKLVVTDLDNRRVRLIDMATTLVTTAAGTGQRGLPADGEPADAQPLIDPRAATLDARGNLYILERSGHALRVVDPAGRIRTLIPGPPRPGAPSVLRGPKHLAIDPATGDVLIADTDHHRVVRWLVKDQKLAPLAGTGKPGAARHNGPPDQLPLHQPHGASPHPDGALYISDSRNARVIRVAP